MNTNDRGRLVHLTRRPGELRVTGLQAPEVADAVAHLRRRGSASVIVSDLSLGSWRGHQLAREFAAQLGCPAPAEDDYGGAKPLSRAYADIVGAGIDAEAAGDANVRRALAWTRAIVAAARERGPVHFLVLLPRFNRGWEVENALFARFLAQNLPPDDAFCVAGAAGETPIVPADWRVAWEVVATSSAAPAAAVALVPGIFDPADPAVAAVAEAHAGWIELPGGCAVAPFAARPAPARAGRHRHDSLAMAAPANSWLQAYGYLHGHNIHVRPGVLAAAAWDRLQEGGAGVALRLIDHAVACSTDPIEKAGYTCQAAGMRISLQRFEEAARIPDPAPSLPAALAFFLLQVKGWALALSGRAGEAVPYLRSAATVCPPTLDTRERLYLQNITALVRFKTGEIDAALALELEIRRELEKLTPSDDRLVYVNSINTARLHLRRREWEASEACYRRAFDTVADLASESDRVYWPICQARVAAARADGEAALRWWLLAALNLLACAAPEAIAPRAAASVLRGDIGDPADRPRLLAAALERELLAAWTAVHPAAEPPAAREAEPPRFVFAENVAVELVPDRIDGLAIGPGWSLLCSRQAIAPDYECAEWTELRRLAAGILRGQANDAACATAPTLILDPNGGLELPQSAEERRRLARRWRLAAADDSRGAPTIRVSGAVASVDLGGQPPRAHFRRYRPACALEPVESALVRQLDSPAGVDDLRRRCASIDHDAFAHALAGLRRKGIVKTDEFTSDEIQWLVSGGV